MTEMKVKEGRHFSRPSSIYSHVPMEVGDKIIWSNGYAYEIGWLQTLKEGEASIKLISGTRKGATVTKPTKELEDFTEASYKSYVKKFGEKFGG